MFWGCRDPIRAILSFSDIREQSSAMRTELRRRFVDLDNWQAHYRELGETGRPPLVMFHGSPGSGFSLVPLMRALAVERHVIAIDSRGNGDSTPFPLNAPTITDYANAHWEVVDAIGLERFDIYGYHTGAAICTQLSIDHGDRINKIILDGVSVFSPDEQGELFDNDHAPNIPIDLEGTQLLRAWNMVRDAHLFWPWWDHARENMRDLGLPNAEYLHGEAIEVLKNCSSYFQSYRAALRYDKTGSLPLINNPTLVTACPTDQLYGFMDRAADLIPNSERIEHPDPRGVREISETARIMLDFLSR